MKIINSLKIAGVAGSLVFGASAAHAASVTYNVLGSFSNGNPKTYISTTIRGTITCSLGCEGLDSTAVTDTVVPIEGPVTSTAGSFVSTHADLFELADNSVATEGAFLTAASGTSITVTDDDKTSGGGSESFSITSSFSYLLFVIGKNPDVFMIKNTGGADNVFTWAGVSGLGSGMSHVTEGGECIDCGGGTGFEVPVPASLPLLLTALGAGGFILRRRQNKAA